MESRSLPMFVRTRSRTLGPKPSLRRVAGGADVSWTWWDTWAHARTLALALLDDGLDEGEPVVLWADDEPEALFAEIGLQAAGAFVVRASPAWDAAFVSTLAQAVGARRLLSFGPAPAALDLVRRARPDLRMRILSPAPPAPPDLGERLDPWSDDPRLEERLSRGGPDSRALAVVSPDGPDSAPIRVLTQRNLLGVGLAVAAALGAGEDDSWWVAGPWRSAFPRTAGMAAAWLSGGDLVLAPGIEDPLQVLWRTRPTVGVLPASLASELARRAADEVSRAEGPTGRLSRWLFGHRLHRGEPGAPDRGWAALANLAGGSALSDVLGGRLTRVVVDGGGPDPESVRRFQALGVSAWAAVGNDATAGVATLDRLPSAGRTASLLPGTSARDEDGGEVSIHGVSAAPPLSPGGDWGSFPDDRFVRTGLKGRVAGDGVAWDDL